MFGMVFRLYMTMRVSIIIGTIMTMIMIANVASLSYAITNSTSNVNRPLYRQIQDLIENPFFGPDYSCLFDAYQLHCIPGDQQECPKGFGQNEDTTCSPRGDCPVGYHGEDEDETGQCYPDTKPCFPGMIRYPERGIAPEACGYVEDVCKEYNMSLPESCFVDGRSIVNFPDVRCLTNPDNDNCDLIEGYGCPDGFTRMTSINFTVPKCIPMSEWDVIKAERLREVYDRGRCKEGYELDVGSYSHVQVLRIPDNAGTCNKID
jgi:hypothetical protein